MTSQFTDEQVEAAAEAAHYAQGFDDYGVANSEERAEAEGIARAALEAAASVAPQARQCEVIHPYRGLRCSEPAEPRHAHVCDQPGQPSGTVDEGKLAEVLHLANHEGCQSVIPTQAERHSAKAIADHLRGASL